MCWGVGRVRRDVGSCWERCGRVYRVSVEGAGKCGEDFFRKISWLTLQYQHHSSFSVYGIVCHTIS